MPVPLFSSKLTQPLKPGQILFVHGFIKDDANSFQVNLLSETPVIDDNKGSCVLHIDNRLSYGEHVLNSLIRGDWGEEEKEPMIYNKGQSFDLRIRFSEDKFEIQGNQKNIHEFKYRLPLESIDFLNVTGDVTLSEVYWGGKYFQLPLETLSQPQNVALHVPFITKLPQKLQHGQTFFVNGTIKEDANSFQINLLSETPVVDEHKGACVLHINNRIDQETHVFKTHIGGEWGEEEKEPMVFGKGQDFALKIRLLEDKFEIKGNEKDIHGFKYRLPLESVDFLNITGDITLKDVHWEAEYFQLPYEIQAHPRKFALPVPFISKLSQKFQPGQTFIAHGFIKDDANSFQVNLLSETPVIDDNKGSCVLHIDNRLSYGEHVLNTLTKGDWGEEEREPMVFTKGQRFDLRIRFSEDKFEIQANQKRLHEYKYRLPLESIDYFNVTGDVTLSGVHLSGKYFKLPFETQFPNGHLQFGDKVIVRGMPKGKRFVVNFIGSNNDMLFHFNPRFDDPTSGNVVVRNSNVGTWGKEEREGDFLFEKEKTFDLVFINEPYSIQMFIDNKRYGSYAHRTTNPGEDYVRISVTGDLELTGLEFSHA